MIEIGISLEVRLTLASARLGAAHNQHGNINATPAEDRAPPSTLSLATHPYIDRNYKPKWSDNAVIPTMRDKRPFPNTTVQTFAKAAGDRCPRLYFGARQPGLLQGYRSNAACLSPVLRKRIFYIAG